MSATVRRIFASGGDRAIKAEGHYARLFDGSGEYFCPMSISDIESRLDSSRFLKTHRSHLVNIAHVSGIQKVGAHRRDPSPHGRRSRPCVVRGGRSAST